MDLDILGLPYMVSNGRGGWVCSACGGGVRPDATYCKHCRGDFFDVARAQTIYQEALQALKANPTNVDLRQHALSIGRAYGSLTRRRQGATIYDEMAVMNDINAIIAGAGAAPSADPVAASLKDRLRRLGELRDEGLINDQEFQARRQKILDEV